MRTGLSAGARTSLVVVGLVGLLVGMIWLAFAGMSSEYVGPPPAANGDGTVSVYEGRPDTDFGIRSAEGTFPVGMDAEEVTVWRVQRETGEGLEEVFRGSPQEAEAQLRSLRDEVRTPVFTGTSEEYAAWTQVRQDEQWARRSPAPMAVLAASVLLVAVGIWPSRHASPSAAGSAPVVRWVGLLVVVLGVLTLLYGMWQPREGSLVEHGAADVMGDVDPDYVRVEGLDTRPGTAGEPRRVGELLFEGQRGAAYLYLRIGENALPAPVFALIGVGGVAAGATLVAAGRRGVPDDAPTTVGGRAVLGGLSGFVVGIAVCVLAGWLYGLGALSYGFLSMGFLLPPAAFSLIGVLFGLAYRPLRSPEHPRVTQPR